MMFFDYTSKIAELVGSTVGGVKAALNRGPIEIGGLALKPCRSNRELTQVVAAFNLYAIAQ